MYNQHKILRVFQLINLLKAKPAKSIRALAKTLNIDNRSVYRYFDLLRELGFPLLKDDFNRYYIESDEEEKDLAFNADEARWLKELILTAGAESPLKDHILRKLYVNSEVQIKGKQLFKTKLTKLTQEISEAIANKRQLILKKYHSANSQNIEDRLVEPIHFTDNYEHLVAFEPASQMIKHFHLERINEVKLTPQAFKYQDQHRESETDIFGFAAQGEKYPVRLEMSLRAYLFLKEEFPKAIPFLKQDKKRDKYILETEVNSLLPVERFMKGLEGEVNHFNKKKESNGV